MAILPIRVFPDPVLRRKAKRVRSLDSSIQKLIDDMTETLRAAPGVGLAAPQVGVALRVMVLVLPEQEGLAIINPEVVRRSGERVVEEGCLSVPGYYAEVKRSESVVVKGHDRAGKELRLKAKELLAQVLEHEIDHLNGVLYVDRLESPDKLRKVEQEDRKENSIERAYA